MRPNDVLIHQSGAQTNLPHNCARHCTRELRRSRCLKSLSLITFNIGFLPNYPLH